MSGLRVELPAEFLELVAQRAAQLVLERQRQQPEPRSPWLTLPEAAEYLRVSERTLERFIARGRVRAATVGRRRIVHRGELDRLAHAATGEDATPATPTRRRPTSLDAARPGA